MWNVFLNPKPELSTLSGILARKRATHVYTVLFLSESKLWEMRFVGNFLKHLKFICLSRSCHLECKLREGNQNPVYALSQDHGPLKCSVNLGSIELLLHGFQQGFKVCKTVDDVIGPHKIPFTELHWVFYSLMNFKCRILREMTKNWCNNFVYCGDFVLLGCVHYETTKENCVSYWSTRGICEAVLPRTAGSLVSHRCSIFYHVLIEVDGGNKCSRTGAVILDKTDENPLFPRTPILVAS